MSDKELLEMAAKAAGYEIVLMCDPHDSGEPQSEFFHLDGKYWNPLTDDGDALRLAVKLYLEIAPACYSKDCVQVYMKDDNCIQETFDDDRYAATRRAIVRAATDIVRKM